ncbi:hypothetical protein ACTHGU_07990 [Chitinophagaceae bacterium MMS25-I14]
MKKKLLSALLLAGTSVALFSCNNGAYTATPSGGTTWNGGGGSVSSGTITAKINGTQWSGTGAATNAGAFIILGMSTDGKIMSLTLDSFAAAKTYTISSTGSSASWATTLGGASTSATSGSIVVTSYQNNQIQGTFQWDGSGLSVTNGAFNLPVQ